MDPISLGTYSAAITTTTGTATAKNEGELSPTPIEPEEGLTPLPVTDPDTGTGSEAPLPGTDPTLDANAQSRVPQPPGQIRKALNQLARVVKNELKDLAAAEGLSDADALELRRVARDFKRDLGAAYREEIAQDGGVRTYDAEALIGRVNLALDGAREQVGLILPVTTTPESSADAGLTETGEPSAPAEPTGPIEPTVVPIVDPAADPIAGESPFERIAGLFERIAAELRAFVEGLQGAGGEEPAGTAVEGELSGPEPSGSSVESYVRFGIQAPPAGDVDAEA